MRYAIFSDLHDNWAGLTAVLADADSAHVDQLIYLGDAGQDLQLFQRLQERNIPCVFGNWEVSGWRRLPAAISTWVGNWPATIRHSAAIFCHATPDIPATITTTASVSSYMAAGVSWYTLFPRLNRNEAARWDALAALEAADARVAFHGHTHVQEVYAWTTPGTTPVTIPVTTPGTTPEKITSQGHRHLRALPEPTEFILEVGDPTAPNRYLVGVGSAGAPDDGPQLRYVLYDDETQQVTLRRL